MAIRAAQARFAPPALQRACASVSAAKSSMIGAFLKDKTELFKKLDADGNGKIEADELHAALVQAGATSVSLADAEVILKEADKNKNGTIEKNELLTVLTKGTIFDGVLKR